MYGKWVELETILLSKISQIQRDEYIALVDRFKIRYA